MNDSYVLNNLLITLFHAHCTAHCTAENEYEDEYATKHGIWYTVGNYTIRSNTADVLTHSTRHVPFLLLQMLIVFPHFSVLIDCLSHNFMHTPLLNVEPNKILRPRETNKRTDAQH